MRRRVAETAAARLCQKKAFMHTEKDGGPEGTIHAAFGRRCEASAWEDAAGAPLMPGFGVDGSGGSDALRRSVMVRRVLARGLELVVLLRWPPFLGGGEAQILPIECRGLWRGRGKVFKMRNNDLWERGSAELLTADCVKIYRGDDLMRAKKLMTKKRILHCRIAACQTVRTVASL